MTRPTSVAVRTLTNVGRTPTNVGRTGSQVCPPAGSQVRPPALALLFLALSSAVCAPAPVVGTAERFETTARVLQDGSVEMREEIAVAFDRPTSSFERRIDLGRVDGLTLVSAAIDGAEVRPGHAGDMRVFVEEGRGLSLVWEFPSASARTFALTYRAVHAVGIHGARGSVQLRVLDPSRRFNVRTASLALTTPGTALYDGSGIAEAGWTVARTADGIAGRRQNLDRAETATIVGAFAIERAVMTDPMWQMNEERAEQLRPAFISGGLFILVIGIGVLWIIRFQHPRTRTGDEAERAVVRRGLFQGGLVCVAFAIVVVAVTELTLSQFGIWPMAMPASILVVGLVFTLVSARIV